MTQIKILDEELEKKETYLKEKKYEVEEKEQKIVEIIEMEKALEEKKRNFNGSSTIRTNNF